MNGNDDFGSWDLDSKERRDAQTFLEDPNDGDDEPWNPPTRQPRGGEFLDDDRHDTIDQRLAQEEPEVADEWPESGNEDVAPDDVDSDADSESDEFDRAIAGNDELRGMHLVDEDEQLG